KPSMRPLPPRRRNRWSLAAGRAENLQVAKDPGLADIRRPDESLGRDPCPLDIDVLAVIPYAGDTLQLVEHHELRRWLWLCLLFLGAWLGDLFGLSLRHRRSSC